MRGREAAAAAAAAARRAARVCASVRLVAFVSVRQGGASGERAGGAFVPVTLVHTREARVHAFVSVWS